VESERLVTVNDSAEPAVLGEGSPLTAVALVQLESVISEVEYLMS